MRSNVKHTTNELEKYIRLFLEEEKSYRELKDEHGLLLSQSGFGQKVLKYKAHGLAGIEMKAKNTRYSEAFKQNVVNEHLEKGTPIKQLVRKYNISGPRTIGYWIIKYTEGKVTKKNYPRPEVYTMTSRKTTLEERLEIVQDYLDQPLSYREIAEKHNVSYNNVYSWVRRYQKHGAAGLADGRGRGKPSSIQTAEEKLQTEIAALKARNEYLETENAALKKLKEMESELISRKQGTKPNTKRSKNWKGKGLK